MIVINDVFFSPPRTLKEFLFFSLFFEIFPLPSFGFISNEISESIYLNEISKIG
jgi:hypothetical protein